MSKGSVLQLPPIRFGAAKYEELVKRGYKVITTKATHRDEFIEFLKSEECKDLVGITRTFESAKITGRFDLELIKHFPQTVKVVGNNGAGYDQVDVQPLTDRGIQLLNVPDLVDGPTLDTNVYLILSCLRNFHYSEQQLLKGEWLKLKCASTPFAHDPYGKTVGILGMGGIGRAVRDRLAPFGFDKVIYYNRNRLPLELEKDSEYVSLEELYLKSDVISINVPLNAHTRHMINQEAINKMKDGVILVNTARGAVVDELIMYDNLVSGKIRSFGSDVFEHEPQVDEKLVSLPQVVALPHVGTHTVETSQLMEEFTVENVISYLETGKVKTLVPEQKGAF